MTEILLGTVAIEPNRWGTLTADRAPTIELSTWIDTIAEAGFAGIEVWDGHLLDVSADEAERVLRSAIATPILNSYADFGPGADAAGSRADAARWATRAASRAVKFNIGNDPGDEVGYVARLSEWIETLAADTAALCECHQGISIAEDPVVAARIFDAAAGPERLQALVHTHDDADLVRAKFDAYGERITHVHVNFIDFTSMTHPPLGDVADRLRGFVDLVRDEGFRGSWTLEFVAGLLSDHDTPEALLAQAAADLPVLRAALS